VPGAYPWGVSIFGVVLLLLAAVLVIAAEWPRVSRGAPKRPRRRKKSHLRVVEPSEDPDEFARAVERDLANLPTYDPNERPRK
jgi:hypothetical protein